MGVGVRVGLGVGVGVGVSVMTIYSRVKAVGKGLGEGIKARSLTWVICLLMKSKTIRIDKSRTGIILDVDHHCQNKRPAVSFFIKVLFQIAFDLFSDILPVNDPALFEF